MKRTVLVLASIGLVLAFIAAGAVPMAAQGGETATPVRSYAGTLAAPDFPAGLDWINTDHPLTLGELRGKVVLLDFWTYGCINCIHIIPDLKRLEAEFANELVIVGVHSAKFKNEGNTGNIRYIVQRYEVVHPVVNDKDFKIWQTYGVEAWPTTVLIDPTGKVLGIYSGEGVYQAMQPIIQGMIAEFDAKKQVDRTPLKFAPEVDKSAGSPLKFPGKVLADPAGKRLFISDSNHNRIIVAALDTYQIKAVIGSGDEGLKDGSFAAAAFFRPQGLALDGETLYVADTENHAVRAVDLKAQTVKMVAGTGRQATSRTQGGPALEIALNSPWDLVFVKGVLYIAMAGPHQLWAFDPEAGRVKPYAGSGREGLADGPLADAQLAQPSGIASDGNVLYFTDPEASAVRTADLDPKGDVKTIVGTGLFDFGDVDGVADAVRLQHALGVTVGPEGKLFVADTYNSKIKVIDPATRESRTLFGKESGLRDGTDPLFYEPGGLNYADGKLYIADTNNHAIRVADLKTGSVTTVKFPNPEALTPRTAGDTSVTDTSDISDADFTGDIVKLDAVSAASGAGKIVLNIRLPEGYKFNDIAPFLMHVNQNSGVVKVAAKDNDLSMPEPTMPVSMPATLSEGQTTLSIDANVYYCEAVNESRCYPAMLRFVMPVKVSKGGGKAEITIEYTIVPPGGPTNTLGK
jgi:thiol-disulfide isomerase/thioredoxin